MIQKRFFALFIILMLLCAQLFGCAAPAETAAPAAPDAATETEAEAPAPDAEPVTLCVAGGWADCRALDLVANAFTEKYPNCTVTYEYLQDYYPSLEKRLSGEEPVDVFFTTNIQQGTSSATLQPYALDMKSSENIHLENTFDGLLQNFLYREESGENTKLYAIPIGAEMRGMYVNVTLLNSLGIPVPTDQASLLAACEKLKQNGYIPFHGNPGAFAQTLIYPWVCNLIANADDPAAAFNRVNARESGLSEMFRAPYAFLYSLVENGYYDYKKAQTDYDLFTETTDEDYARYFLSIKKQGETFEKADDLGMVAFMPSPMSLQSTIDKTKDDYHSGIEYAFIPAPVGEDGGFAYLSPAHGIAIYKDSENLEWAERFIDFLFQPENNKAFAEAFHVIPNTAEAFSYISTLFDMPDTHISHLGQVTFDYGFYEAITPSMTDTSKANNPKYMQDDGKGNLSLYPLSHFMEELELNLQGQ